VIQWLVWNESWGEKKKSPRQAQISPFGIRGGSDLIWVRDISQNRQPTFFLLLFFKSALVQSRATHRKSALLQRELSWTYATLSTRRRKEEKEREREKKKKTFRNAHATREDKALGESYTCHNDRERAK
jgi:hypothetical protein